MSANAKLNRESVDWSWLTYRFHKWLEGQAEFQALGTPVDPEDLLQDTIIALSTQHERLKGVSESHQHGVAKDVMQKVRNWGLAGYMQDSGLDFGEKIDQVRADVDIDNLPARQPTYRDQRDQPDAPDLTVGNWQKPKPVRSTRVPDRAKGINNEGTPERSIWKLFLAHDDESEAAKLGLEILRTLDEENARLTLRELPSHCVEAMVKAEPKARERADAAQSIINAGLWWARHVSKIQLVDEDRMARDQEDLVEHDEECWYWTGARTGRPQAGTGLKAGYVKEAGHGRQIYVRRLFWEALIGEVPVNRKLVATCAPPEGMDCCNPWHQRPMTQAEANAHNREKMNAGHAARRARALQAKAEGTTFQEEAVTYAEAAQRLAKQHGVETELVVTRKVEKVA